MLWVRFPTPGRTGTRNRAVRALGVLVVLLLFGGLVAGTGTVVGQSAPNCSTVTYSGDGSVTTPYEVSDVDELQCVGNTSTTTTLSDNFALVSDVDASATSSWNGGAGFEPINGTPPLTGSFDGMGNEINNLTINRPSTDNVGLFGRVGTNGVVEGVRVLEVNITANDNVGGVIGINLGGDTDRLRVTGTIEAEDDVGGLIGDNNAGDTTNSYAEIVINATTNGDDVGGLIGIDDGGDILNSNATGEVSLADSEVGGLVGENDVGRTVDSYAEIDITAEGDNVGGLIGIDEGKEVVRSYATGDVVGGGDTGGLVGENEDSNVTDSYSTGDADGGTDNDVGGLVGLNEGTVTDSYATGNASGGFDVGGLVGDLNGGTVERSRATGNAAGTDSDDGLGGLVGDARDGAAITESFATGSVTGDSNNAGGLVGELTGSGTLTDSYTSASVDVTGSDVGGLIGLNEDTIERTYAVGSVNGGSNVGGLVGRNNGGSVVDSYWDVDTTGQASSDGGTGKTTEEMKKIETFTDTATDGLNAPWDMETTQGFDPTDGYPFLSWQSPGNSPVWLIVEGAVGCIDRRDLGRGQEDQECSRDRGISRGESREDLDKETGRDSDTARRDRGRGESRRNRGRSR